MSDRDKPPTTDEVLTQRVEVLEAQVATLQQDVLGLDERVTTLEGGGVEPEPPEPEPPLPEPGAVSLTLAFADGSTLEFSESEAEDKGDYVGEFVQQRCLMQQKGAWTVFFRPDVDGGRYEIVVEYGAYDFSLSPTVPIGNPVHILEPYTATLRGTVAREDHVSSMIVPKHYWLTRWRWQSAPRPVVRSHDDLVAMHAILPLDIEATWNDPPPLVLANAIWSGPMGTGGLQTAMGTTGDRQEIGPITNLQASYLVHGNGNSEALTGMLAQAEAVGSFPFWLRDAGGGLIDVYEHPYEGLLYTADAAKYPKLYPAAPSGDAQFFKLDTAHHPAVAYVPWLLTDDPYFLEGAQMQAIFHTKEGNYHQLNQKLPGLAAPSQKRGWGWGFRDITRMAVIGSEHPPSWLRPRAMFHLMALDNIEYIRRHMTSQVKAPMFFEMLGPNNAGIASWEEGYCVSGFGWLRWTRALPEADDALDWAAGTVLAFTGDKGWDRRWPACYRTPLNRMRTIAVDPSIPGVNTQYNVLPEPYAAETPDSYAELWTLYQQWWISQGTPLVIGGEDKIYENRTDNPNTCPSSPHYHEVALGALGALAFGGMPGAQEQYDWLRAHMQPVYDSYGGVASSFRYAYLPG